MNRSIWIGFDPRETDCFAIARWSVARRLSKPIPIYGLVLSKLQESGLYYRPMEYRRSAVDKPIMWDCLSEAPMSTEHANARFLVPHLAKTGWALFMDGDMLGRGDLCEMFDTLDPAKAVYCVKHCHRPDSKIKMDGQAQTQYARKNWSSFMVFNCDHEENQKLTLEMINTRPGRDLHRLCWLPDDLIGELGPEWNYLVGHSDKSIDPKVVHFTDGTPTMIGYENGPYTEDWRRERDEWAGAEINGAS